MVILDLETDGLYPSLTKIHCAVAYDTEAGVYKEFTPRTIHLLPVYLDTVPRLCMHNGIGFDLKVLKKIFNYDYKGYFVDSLLLSYLLWPDIEKPVINDENGKKITIKGKHSVEAWGARFGINKPENEDWSEFTDHMLYRCKEDVRIQTQLYKKCELTITNYKQKDKRLNKWNQIIALEQDFWKGMEIQAENGWLLDRDKTIDLCTQLTSELNETESELDKCLPYIVKNHYKSKECIAFKKDGTLTSNAQNWITQNFTGHNHNTEVVGNFSRVKFEKLNLNSPDQVKTFLLKEGWIPANYNFKKDIHNKPVRDETGKLILTTPKIPKELEEWEQVAKQTNSPTIILLSGRTKKTHRLNMLKGFLENIRDDGRLEARMISCGTNTSRARHINIVNIPRADERSYFGKECRSVFTVPEGKVLVGVDACSLEARCEAHYMYKLDKEAATLLVDGDIHSYNAKVWDVDRGTAKSGKYALLYGCSPDKLATVLNKPSSQAKELHDMYWKANPATKTMVNLLQEQFKSKGYLVAIDGRPLSIRYTHALLNTLLQSAGAIVMKQAWCIFNRWRIENNMMDAVLDVGNFHDELQIETYLEIAEDIGKAIVKSIGLAGQMLKFNIPLTGEYKIGMSWLETH